MLDFFFNQRGIDCVCCKYAIRHTDTDLQLQQTDRHRQNIYMSAIQLELDWAI